jgi:hypothetical protein
MINNYTKDVYNKLMKSKETTEPEPKKTGLLTRMSKQDSTTVTDLDLVLNYVDAIQSERGRLADG